MINKIKNQANRIRLIAILMIAALIPQFHACTDYLNVEYLLNKEVDLNEVFSDLDYSKRWLAGVYSCLRNRDNWDVCIKEQNANQFNFISDDMYYTDREKENDKVFGQLASYRIYRGGQYTEQFLQEQWDVCYLGIRNASIYIHNIDLLKTSATSMNPQQLDTYIKETKAEARFLRAYLYWQLLRKYGPIPLMPDEGVSATASYEELSIPRRPYNECVDYIANELAVAARDLPLRADRNPSYIFKASKGAALAARAKVYLFGASPQYNPQPGTPQSAWAKKLVSFDGSPLIPEYDEGRWALAAAAAKEVMELGVYSLNFVRIRDDNTRNMNGASGSALKYDYYASPKTITPMGEIVLDGSNYKIKFPDEVPGYSDRPFNGGEGECGWADIDPCESYRTLFDGSIPAYSNLELIFSRGYGNEMDNLSQHQMPQSQGGWNCHGLTLKMYDAYYMANGEDFYRYKLERDEYGRLYYYSDLEAEMPGWIWNTSAAEGKKSMCTIRQNDVNRYPYTYQNWRPLPVGVSMQNANREPRFYASVAYNGSIWENLGAESKADGTPNHNEQIFIYRNSPTKDGKNATGFYYWTGIGIRKYYNPMDCSSYRVPKAEPAIRYAEVLLTYAEALNELTHEHIDIPRYDGTGTITVSRTPEEISKGLRPVRVRAGLTDFTDDKGIYSDREEMRVRIKREWQIEFMGESHRYYDLRRWGDAEREEAMPVWGFNMDMTGPTTISDTEKQRDYWLTPHKISIIPAIFSEKMKLWPISQDELRRNRRMTQNPGWKTFEE